jgi:hypothetical protein
MDDLELLSAYLDSAIPEDERLALEVRLASDSALRRELEALQQTKTLLAALPPLKSPRNFILDSAQIRPVRHPLLLSPWVSRLSAAAAAFLLVAGVLLNQVRPLASVMPQAALESEQQIANAPTETMSDQIGVMDAALQPTPSAIRQSAVITLSPTPLTSIGQTSARSVESTETLSVTDAALTPPALYAATSLPEANVVAESLPAAPEVAAASGAANDAAEAPMVAMATVPASATARPTLTAITMTMTSSLTETASATPSPTLVAIATALPTPPIVIESLFSAASILIGGGVFLLIVAVLTTLLRYRRQR